jgi:hypothetical protein
MAKIDVSKMSLPEIMQHVSDLTNEDRPVAMQAISRLRPDFKAAIQLVFVDGIQIDLPAGAPPYKKLDMPENWGYNRLPRELKKMHYFIKGSTSNLTKAKKESMFIEMLESLSPQEAKLLIQIKDKKLEYKGITKRYVKKAFPEFFPGEKEE